jgi:uroporphyrinogen decarboxylase
MTHLERCMRALAWEKPDRVPVAPQNSHFAARFAGFNLLEYSKDPKKQASAHLESQEKFGYDAIICGGDTAMLAEACGCETEYSEEFGPRTVGHVLDDLKDVKNLKPIDPGKSGRLKNWIEATRILREKVGDKVCIISRVDQGAFSLATLLRGIDTLMMDLALDEQPDLIHELLRYCNSCFITFMNALIDAGAHIVTSGDSISGPDVVSPDIYRQYSLPYEKEISAECRRRKTPFSIHICGKTDAILDQWTGSGAEIFEIDHKTNFILAREKTLGKVCLLGNLDCADVLDGGAPEDVRAAAKKIIETAMPESGFILSSGCLMSQNTPTENMEALVSSAREFGQY